MTNDTTNPAADAGRLDQPVRPHVTSMRITYATGDVGSKPKAGDRRTTKKYGLQIRVQRMARDFITGAPMGRIVSRGRPVYDWRKPVELDSWDLHLLTAEERAHLMPLAA